MTPARPAPSPVVLVRPSRRRVLAGLSGASLSAFVGPLRAQSAAAPPRAAATARSPAGRAPLVPAIGQRLPAREFIDAEQRRHGPERWRGRALVLNVWATWCGPCREEMPSLARLAGRLAGRPVDIVALNIGESENRLDQFTDSVREHPPIVRDALGDLMKAWRIPLLPTTYLVDAAGALVRIEAGARDWSADAALALVEPLIPR